MMTNMKALLDKLLERVGKAARLALVTSVQLSEIQKNPDPAKRKQVGDNLKNTVLDGMRMGQAVSLILEHLRDTELTPEQQFLASDILAKIQYCVEDHDMKGQPKP
jgi:hypothetical protein